MFLELPGIEPVMQMHVQVNLRAADGVPIQTYVHHTVHDTLDRVDLSTLPQNVACWAVTAWLAAQAPMAFGPLPR